MTSLVLSLLVALLTGLLVDRALLGRPGRGPLEHLGRGLMLGLGTVGSLSILVDGLGLGVSRASLGGALVVLLLACLPLLRRPASPDPTPAELPAGEGAGPLHWALVLVLLLVAAFGLGVAVRSGWLRPTFQFDAVTRWMFKTRALFVDGTLLGTISTDPDYGLTHQRYPPLVSHVALLPALMSGAFNDRIASAIYPWYAVALSLVCYGALARRVGRLTGALAAAWIGHLPLISFVIAPPPGAGAASAMADIPLSLFVTGAVLAAADAVEGRRDRAHLEAGLLLGFATLTKNEALPLVAALALGLALASQRGRWRAALGVAGLGGLLYALLWGRIAAGLPVTDEHYPAQLNLEAFLAGLERLRLILPALGQELVDLRSWNLTWPALAVLLAVGGGLWRRRALRLIWIVLLVQLASYVFAYMITAWTSPAAVAVAEKTGEPDVLATLLRLTLGRLLLQIAPAAICLGLLASPLVLRRPAAPGPAGG